METSQAIIVNYTPEPERICGSAARISTTHGTAAGIYENSNKENTEKLIPRVIKLGHTSTIEHIYFNIAFENVSVFAEQFMIEFRLASFTVKSRRYVDFSKMGYYKPLLRTAEGKEADHEVNKEFEAHIENLFRSYEEFIEKGIPKEDARFILPYCFRSNFYCSVNARELVHIIHACLKGRGKNYPELVNLGSSLLKQARRIIPAIFDNFDNLEKGIENKETELARLLKDISPEPEQTESLCELLSYTPEPAKQVGISALIKHKNISTLQASKLAEDKDLMKNILKIVISDKRARELEHISSTFRINNLTLASLTHLVRHRIQSISIPSFTEAGKSSICIIPDSVKENPELLAKYSDLIDENNKLYEKLTTLGIAGEDLSYLYLAGNMLDVVTTINARELLHFMKLRTCSRAQWEIRLVAIEMLKKLREVSPELYNYYGPSCYVTGTCPEGKMCCGKTKEMSEYFGNTDSLEFPPAGAPDA